MSAHAPPPPNAVPNALVLRWNSQTLRAQCPYCLYSHGHGFARPDAADNIDQTMSGWKLRIPRKQRRSDCHDAQGGDYVFVFPPANGLFDRGYGWEVDRENGEFVTVDHQGKVAVPMRDGLDGRTLLPQYCEQHEIHSDPGGDVEENADDLVHATAGLSVEDDAERSSPARSKTTEEILAELYSDPEHRRTMYVSHCCSRELQELKALCRHYPHDHFIGSVDEEGNTGSLFAATEENGLDTLRWLHSQGDPIGQANHYGRTPLMEAALWARLKTVQYLAEQPIDLGALDGNGMNAADLAADTPRNTKERETRAWKIYREPANASRQRQLIKALLDRRAPPTPGPSKGSVVATQRRAFFSRNSDGTLEISRPDLLLAPPPRADGTLQTQKAFATLDRGPDYPYINVMSGFSHPNWPNVLDNDVWTDRAGELRALLGLPEDRVAASHVEPQLLAYLLHRHSLVRFRDDGFDNRKLMRALPNCELDPIITVNKADLCDECLEFFEHFKQAFPGFNVTFHCVGDSTRAPFVRS